MGNVRRPLAALLASLLVAAVGGACGSSNGGSTFHGNGDDDASTDGSSFDSSFQFGDGQPSFGDGALPGDAAGLFDVEPSALQTITVAAGQTTPTVVYKATLAGNPIAAAWTVDRGDLGSIGAGPAPQETLQPTGTTGGLVNVIAGYGGKTVQRPVFIQITASQNGVERERTGRGPADRDVGRPARRRRRHRRRRRRGSRRRA